MSTSAIRHATVRRRAACLVACVVVFVTACQPVSPVKPIDAWTFEGFEVRSFIPKNPVGIVFVFHGSGGSARSAEKVEAVDMMNRLVTAGYGYVATSSTNRASKQWNTSSFSLSANADLARLARLHRRLVNTTGVKESTPVFALGMSNGAAMSTVFGQAFADGGYPVRAIAAFNGPVPVAVTAAGGLDVPTLFHLSDNDSVVNNARIRTQHESLAARGVKTKLVTSPELSLHARFTRIPSVSAGEQDKILAALRATGVWNKDGKRVVALSKAIPKLTDVVTNGLPASLDGDRGEIGDQVAIILAEHEFSALHQTAVVDFFD